MSKQRQKKQSNLSRSSCNQVLGMTGHFLSAPSPRDLAACWWLTRRKKSKVRSCVAPAGDTWLPAWSPAVLPTVPDCTFTSPYLALLLKGQARSGFICITQLQILFKNSLAWGEGWPGPGDGAFGHLLAGPSAIPQSTPGQAPAADCGPGEGSRQRCKVSFLTQVSRCLCEPKSGLVLFTKDISGYLINSQTHI